MRSTTQKAFLKGDLELARQELQATAATGRPQLEMLATIDYMEGRYTDAISHLCALLDRAGLHPVRRYRVKRRLSLAYFQTGQFEKAASLRLGDPLTRLMRSFSVPPNVIDWARQDGTRIPFLQKSDWELPRIDLTINGRTLTAKIDTGGDLLSVPWGIATSLGIKPAATSNGRFAGGKSARVGWGKAEQIELGGVRIANAPISLNQLEHPVIGTGLLRLFLPTLDYPRHRLSLKPRDGRPSREGVPFLLAGTHLLIVEGTISSVATKLLVDSGLEVDNGASFLASDEILRTAGIRLPNKTRIAGTSGAGVTKLDCGTFSVDEVRLGSISRPDLIGMTGIFPKQLATARTLGFPLGGLISHNFLRHYSWTINFDEMKMTLEQPQTAS